MLLQQFMSTRIPETAGPTETVQDSQRKRRVTEILHIRKSPAAEMNTAAGLFSLRAEMREINGSELLLQEFLFLQDARLPLFCQFQSFGRESVGIEPAHFPGITVFGVQELILLEAEDFPDLI